MTVSDELSCARHGAATRVTCTSCGAPICPRCMVETPVGHKCPDCTRQPKAATPGLKVAQAGRAVPVAAGSALLGGVLLALWMTTVGFLVFIAAYAMGAVQGTYIVRAAGGNRSDATRRLAAGAALAAAGIAIVATYGSPIPSGIIMLAYPAAAYGAWTRV